MSLALAPNPSRPAGPAAPASPYHLTAEQVEFFDTNGYLVLRGWIPADLLGHLQDAATAWIATGHALAADDPAQADFQYASRPSGEVMYRIDYLHAKGRAESLALLGAPEMLGIAESLCGPSFVPTYESLVFKNEGDGAPIPWHQDAVHPRRHRIVNVDVYLDSSRAGEGALRVVPGSQTQKNDVCLVRDEHGWTPPGAVQVELEPGDVLLHDVMVVHGSEPVRDNPLRRTIYYEFRPAEQILSEGPWDRDWVDARMRLMPVALAEHARLRPDAAEFAWQPAEDLRPDSSGDREVELRLAHLVSSPGSFCSAGDVALPPA
ncbi:phytanoyl-CoA dioxygenase family protein [uncultured Friedmanniella sp.]|uniref:phytanoyl-CoA dioxygenase family protein n=1 Tax=uncultured Friedmanniella sp. TaxID=335381 RepID=UPI0035CBB66E